MSVEDISLNKTCGECPLNAEIDGNNIYFQINCDIYICNACDTEACNLWGVRSMPDKNSYENDFDTIYTTTIHPKHTSEAKYFLRIVAIVLFGGIFLFALLTHISQIIKKRLKEVN